MISMEKARSLAQQRIDQWNIESSERAERLDIELPMLVLNEAPLDEGEYGWVFGYQSKQFLTSGSISDMLAGNAPLLICRRTGELFELGTAEPTETYIDNFVRFGHPQLEA